MQSPQLMGGRGRTQRLAPEVSRVLYVRNLPFKINGDELYDIFGKYGSIRQIRRSGHSAFGWLGAQHTLEGCVALRLRGLII